MDSHEMAKLMLKLYPNVSEDDLKKYPDIKAPNEGECCGRGCHPCVWDYYFQAIQKKKTAK